MSGLNTQRSTLAAAVAVLKPSPPTSSTNAANEFSRLLARQQDSAPSVPRRAEAPVQRAPLAAARPHPVRLPPPQAQAPLRDPSPPAAKTDAPPSASDSSDDAAAPAESKPSKSSTATRGKAGEARHEPQGDRSPGGAESAAAEGADADASDGREPASTWPSTGLAEPSALPVVPSGLVSSDSGVLAFGVDAAQQAFDRSDALNAAGAGDRPTRDVDSALTGPLALDSAALPPDAGLRPVGLPDAALASIAALAAGASADAEPADRTPGADATLSPIVAGGVGVSPLVRHTEASVAVAAGVSTPLSDPGFHEALGLQVSLLARDGVQQAELRLNPADMGPVSVSITMQGDQARVDFGADLAQTRQVIEAGWAELAASLQEAGFTLNGGGVSEHARGRQAPQGQGDRSALREGSAAEDEPVAVLTAARPRAGAALDLYA